MKLRYCALFLIVFLLFVVHLDATKASRGLHRRNKMSKKSASNIAKSKFSMRDKGTSSYIKSTEKASYWFVFKSFWLTLVHPTYYADVKNKCIEILPELTFYLQVLSRELKISRSIFKRKRSSITK